MVPVWAKMPFADNQKQIANSILVYNVFLCFMSMDSGLNLKKEVKIENTLRLKPMRAYRCSRHQIYYHQGNGHILQ